MDTHRVSLFALLIALAVAGFFGFRWRQSDAQLRQHVAWTQSFMDSVSSTMEFPKPPYMGGVRDSVYWQWVATGATLRARQMQNVARHWVSQRQTLLDDIDLMHLKEKGLDDPPRQLRESLVTRADLIPFPGELGGTMRFDEENIVLLGEPYAFAEFEDGHVFGHLLASYSIEPGGRIQWSHVWSTLE